MVNKTRTISRHFKAALYVFAMIGMAAYPVEALAQVDDLLVRIAEIEIDARYLAEYSAALTEEAEASVKLERGVIAIFPMYQKENATLVRILEIYADRAAYDAHLASPHFLKYKATTLKMVKSLKLVEMRALDKNTMTQVFAKLREAR